MRNEFVLTPHTKDFYHLTGILLPNELSSRVRYVESEAKTLGCTILLKAHFDIISNGVKTLLNKTGTPSMTVGGTGDTLAGIVGALFAMKNDPLTSAAAGAYINGKAGELAEKKHGSGTIPSDIIEEIPKVIKMLNESKKWMNIKELLNKLRKIYGRQKSWWPKYSRNHVFEIGVGAILTQQTRWENVEKVLKDMIKLGIISPEKIAKMDFEKLKKIVKPCGFPSIKAKRLKEFSEFVLKEFNGNLSILFSMDVKEARKKLISIRGIGKETADDILLYAGNMKTIPIDYYTKRLFGRLGIIKSYGYETIRKFILDEINDVNDLKELHALIVEHSKNVCKEKPKCEKCPIKNSCKYYKLIKREKYNKL